jgi:hypothetical protein
VVRRRDPVLAAGHVTCPTCAAVAYPCDACWLDASFVIAVFPTVCIHLPGTTRVISPASLPIDVRCQAITRAGARCKLRATASGWCAVHASGAVTVCPAEDGQL